MARGPVWGVEAFPWLRRVATGVTVHETSERLSYALGEAVVRLWGRSPWGIQRDLFEEVAAHGRSIIRPQLAGALGSMVALEAICEIVGFGEGSVGRLVRYTK